MLTSTGCPYKCTFCAIAGLNHYRERTPASVLAEIKECYYEYGVREIDFFDACFFVNKKRCMEIFHGLKKMDLDLSWTCRSRVDLVDNELLQTARDCGLRMIFWGIESADKDILTRIDKNIVPAQTEAAVGMARKLKIKNLGFLMIGNAGEERNDVVKTINWAKKLELDYAQICRTIPKPGSLLNRQITDETGQDYWRDFILGKEQEKRIFNPQSRLTEEEAEKLLKWAYYSYYFRLRFILRTLVNTRSLGELLRYCRVAIRMLSHYFYTDVRFNKNFSFFRFFPHK